MSHQSLLNIQQISSRTYHNDPSPSIMETSIQNFSRNSPSKFDESNKKSISINFEEILHSLKNENDNYKKELYICKNKIFQLQRGNGMNASQEGYIKQLVQQANRKDEEIKQIKKDYLNAISNLKQTIQKNDILSKEVSRLTKKLKESQLNYSRDVQVFRNSQNLIENLSVARSHYEIEVVNMKDSLIILQKENHKIMEVNEQYQQKMALVSQQVERLRGLLEKYRKQSEMHKSKHEENAIRMKKYDADVMQQKSVIQRLRMQNRQFNGKISSLSLQLRQYHEKLVYKQTVIKDNAENENTIKKIIKDKDQYIKELESRLIIMDRSTKIVEEQFSKQKNQYSQEVGKLRSKINDQTLATKHQMEELYQENQRIFQQNQKITKDYGFLRGELERSAAERNAIIGELNNISQERDMLLRQKDSLIRQLDSGNSEMKRLISQIQNYQRELTQWHQKDKQIELSFKKYQEKEQIFIKQYQYKVETISQQKNAEIAARINELNQFKFEYSNKINEINQLKSQLSTKTNELSRLSDEKMYQSTIIDTTKKDYDQKLNQKNNTINDLKVRLSNCEKLMEQNRRERDLIFQQKNSMLMQTHKSEQVIQIKSNQLRATIQKTEELSKQINQYMHQIEYKGTEIQNYKRVINDNQNVIKQLGFKYTQSEKRLFAITNELERVTSILRDKDLQINDLSSRNRQLASLFDEKKEEFNNLKKNFDHLNINFNRTDQSKNNFQLFLKEIDRLNHAMIGKETEITNLRVELNVLIQKIDIISQEQLKIIKILEASYSNSLNQESAISSQFSQLRQFIGRLNQNTNVTLKDLFQQNGNIIGKLDKNEGDIKNTKIQLQEKLSEAATVISSKQAKIAALNAEVQHLKSRLVQCDANTVQQEEIFQKIIEITRQNAAIREQLAILKSEHQHEIDSKSQNIKNLEAQVSHFEKIQQKELNEIKFNFQQNQQQYQASMQQASRERQTLVAKLSHCDAELRQKTATIAQLHRNMENITIEIDRKMKDMAQMAHSFELNQKEIERYQKIIQSYQQNQSQRNMESDSHEFYQKQIAKLEKIIELRNEQFNKNEESYSKIQRKNQQLQIELKRSKIELKQFKIHTRSEELLQKEELVNKLNTYQATIDKLQSTLRESSIQIGNHRDRDIKDLKTANEKLERQIQMIYAKLRESEMKLGKAKEQINHICQEYYKILEINSSSISKLERYDEMDRDRQQFIEKIYQLEDELQNVLVRTRQYEIENDFLKKDAEQSKIFLHTYEYKTSEVEKEYKKLKQVYSNLSSQYSKIQLKNHQFEIQMGKAEILQQKIHVLNGEINRLSLQNIDLSEEISSCKFAMCDQMTVERRSEEQLMLIVILMAEVESLRHRVQDQEVQLKNSRVLNLSRYRN